MFVDNVYWDALHAHPLTSLLVLDAYLELTPQLLINVPCVLVHAKHALMLALVKPVKWVMSSQARVVFKLAPSLVQHAMLMQDVRLALKDIHLLVLLVIWILPVIAEVAALTVLLDTHSILECVLFAQVQTV